MRADYDAPKKLLRVMFRYPFEEPSSAESVKQGNSLGKIFIGRSSGRLMGIEIQAGPDLEPQEAISIIRRLLEAQVLQAQEHRKKYVRSENFRAANVAVGQLEPALAF